jgi:hypothetical protein
MSSYAFVQRQQNPEDLREDYIRYKMSVSFFFPKYLTFRQIFSEIEKHASCKVSVVTVEFKTKLEYAGKFL